MIVLAAVVALASPAAAQPADDADAKGKALFDEGKRAIEAEDIEKACRKFEESYVVSGVPGIAEVLDQPSGLRLVLAAGADPATVLRALVRQVDVTDFRSEVPDLETLFIQAVRHAN